MNLDGAANPVLANTARSTPTMSPRSPLVSHDGSHANVPEPTADPRKTLNRAGTLKEIQNAEPNRSAANPEERRSLKDSTTLSDILLLHARKVIIEQRVEQNQDAVAQTRSEINVRSQGKVYPHISDYFTMKLAHQQQKLEEAETEKQEIDRQIKVGMRNLNSDTQAACLHTILAEVGPSEPKPSKAEYDALLVRVAEVEKREERDLSARTNLPALESKFQAQMEDMKRQFEVSMNEFKQSTLEKLKTQELSLAEHRAFLDSHKASISEQESHISALKESVVETTKMMGSISQKIEVLSSNRNTVPQHELEELKAEVKDHKIKLTNLLNQSEYTRDHRGSLEELKSLSDSVKLLQTQLDQIKTSDLAELRQDVKNTKLLVDSKLNTLQATTDESKKLASAADLLPIHEQLKLLQTQWDEISNAQAVLQTAPATNGHSNVDEPTSKVDELEKEIEMLKSIRDEYGKFCTDTETTQKSHAESINQLKITHNSTKDAVERLHTYSKARFDSLEPRFVKLEQYNAKTVDQNTLTPKQLDDKLSSVLPAEIQKHAQRIVSATFTASLGPLSAEVQAVKRDIDILKHEKGRDQHTIQALDARYNAISTQSIFKHVIGWIEPKVSSLDRVAADREQLNLRLDRLEQEAGNLKAQMQENTATAAIAQTQAQMHTRMTELEAKLVESSHRADQPVNNDSQAKDQLDERLKSLEEQLDQIRNTGETSRQVCEEMQQSTDAAYGTVREELTTIRQQWEDLNTKNQHNDAVVRGLQEKFDATIANNTALSTSTNSDGTVQDNTGGDSERHDAQPPNSHVANAQSQLGIDANGQAHRAEDPSSDTKDFRRPPPPSRPIGTIHTRTAEDNEVIDLEQDDIEDEAPEVWIVLGNVASKIDEDKLREKLSERMDNDKLPRFTLRGVWFRGQKGISSIRSDRRAVLQLNSAHPVRIIDALNSKEVVRKTISRKQGREEGREVLANEWSGRTIEARQATIEEARAIINETESLPVAATPSRHVPRDSVISIATTTSTRDTPMAAPASAQPSEIPSPTVLTSATRKSANQADQEADDATEMQSTDDPLTGWNARTDSGSSKRVKKKTQIGSRSNARAATETPTIKRKRNEDAQRGGKKAKPN